MNWNVPCAHSMAKPEPGSKFDTSSESNFKRGAVAYLALIASTLVIAFFTRHTMIFGDSLNYLRLSTGCKDMAPIINNEFASSCLQGYPKIKTYLVNGIILTVLGCFLLVASKEQTQKRIAMDLQAKSYIAFLTIWALFFPEILFKFGEPSKEYLVYYPLFIMGIAAYLRTSSMFIFAIIGSLITIVGRPESFPLYIICIIIYFAIDKFIEDIEASKRPLNLWLTMVAALVLGPIALKYLVFNVVDFQAPTDYHGILGKNYVYSAWSAPIVTLLNLFGGIRTTLFAQELSDFRVVTAVYTFNYLWKACLYIFILKERRLVLGLYLLASASLLASVYPYPHDRYMIPIFAIGAGMEAGKMLNIRKLTLSTD